MTTSFSQKRNFIANQELSNSQKDSNLFTFHSVPIYNSSNNLPTSPMEISSSQKIQNTFKIKQKTKNQINNFEPDLNTLAKIDDYSNVVKSVKLGNYLLQELSPLIQQIFHSLKEKQFKEINKKGLLLMKQKILNRFNQIMKQRQQNFGNKKVSYQYDEAGIWEIQKGKFLQLFLKEQLIEFQNKSNIQNQQRQMLQYKMSLLQQKLKQIGYNIKQEDCRQNLQRIINLQCQDTKQSILKIQNQNKRALSHILKKEYEVLQKIKKKKKENRRKQFSEGIAFKKSFVQNQGLNKALFQLGTPFRIKQSLKQLEFQRKNIL